MVVPTSPLCDLALPRRDKTTARIVTFYIEMQSINVCNTFILYIKGKVATNDISEISGLVDPFGR